MGANIDYAIVTTSRFMEFKDKMPKKDAIIQTMNLPSRRSSPRAS